MALANINDCVPVGEGVNKWTLECHQTNVTVLLNSLL